MLSYYQSGKEFRASTASSQNLEHTDLSGVNIWQGIDMTIARCTMWGVRVGGTAHDWSHWLQSC